jgi:predicted nucleotidyltransferase
MRLSDHDREAIRRATAEVAGASARVYLFGSRTNDHQRGGDIDLLVELPEPSADRLSVSVATAARLQRLIGQRKIDVLVTDPLTVETPLIRAARAQRIQL